MNDNYITGKFGKTIFYKDNFFIGTFKIEDSSVKLPINTRVLGYIDNVITFETYKLYGKVINDPKYGKEFKFDHFEVLPREDENSIINYLSSPLFKGIGEGKARLIYNKFKEKTIDVIKNEPDKLLLIKGVTETNVNTLHEGIIKNSSQSDDLMKLNELGFKTEYGLKIIKLFGNKAIKKLEKDIFSPYYYLNIPYNIFIKAAHDNKYDINDTRVLKALVYKAFRNYLYSKGHIYLKIEDIYNAVSGDWELKNKINEELLEDALKSLIKEEILIKDKDKYYLKSDYEDEDFISSVISKKLGKHYLIKEKIIEDFLDTSKIKYSNSQRKAIQEAAISKFLIITGGPGTGKTTIINALANLYSKHLGFFGLKLLAPTGRAAKRLSEVTGFDAATIHSFLEWNKTEDTFNKGLDNKAYEKVIIVDEFSMVNSSLFASLLKAISNDAILILVGDADQLPSVGPGNVLRDLIESTKEVLYLTDLYRQDETSNIVKLANSLNNNEKLCLEEDKSLKVIKANTEDARTIIEKIATEENAQILAPIYRNNLGIDKFNKDLQESLNHHHLHKIGSKSYKIGDKVINTKNMPDLDIYNGDIGEIYSIDKNSLTVIFDYHEEPVKYTRKMLENLDLAYAISIHKSQGSEFPKVILPLSMTYKDMNYKKLYYTAITRAKEKLYLVGDVKALEYASGNNLDDKRNTDLKRKIKEKLK